MGPRIGIVGLGFMGTEHAKRIREVGGDVVAGADVSEAARESFAEEFDGVATYADAAEMYASDVDGVVVTAPNALHEELSVGALEAGLDVLVEKPLAHTLESAERIAAAARDADGFCMPNFQMRQFPEVQALLDRATAGDLGDVFHVETRYVRASGAPARGWFADPDLAGGGALVDIGVHVLDLALAALGYPTVESVYGRVRQGRSGLDVEDSASALVRCEDGQSISLEVSWDAAAGTGKSLAVRGTDGDAFLDAWEPALTFYDVDGGGEGESVELPDHDWLQPGDAAFVEAVAAGEAPDRAGVEEGLTVQRVVDAIYRSDRADARIELER